MAVSNAMFIFEVVVENVESFVDSRMLVIKSDFANIFSLELKDPKQLDIVMPEPTPLPPEPPGKKKGKKKKPKPKKGKKGKKGKNVVVLPPKGPEIQSGQSVLFTCSAEILIQNMKKSPMEVSLWNKEKNDVFIGSGTIPWDPVYIAYLEKIAIGETLPPVTLKDDYNIFQEGSAKLMAKLSMQIKLSWLGEKVTSAFRTLSEDPIIKKVLYTGLNDKLSSYVCTMKTTDEDFEANCNKIENKFIVDKPKIIYADYKNAPGANLTSFNEEDYCCIGSADKPPDSQYNPPETCPDIDFIIDYVRKIIASCNNNMRMLTPRPTITPRIKATDIDRLCYCQETAWPKGKFAERFKKEALSSPCAVCIESGKKEGSSRAATFDIANIRGPCGKPDCKVARDIRAYIEKLVEEDNEEFDINEIIGPCGSRSCTLAEKIQEFLRHEGTFKEGDTLEGLPTQCACINTMFKALAKKTSCDSACSKACDETASDETDICEGTECPFAKESQKVYNVYYFTVEYNISKDSSGHSSTHDEKSIPSSPRYDDRSRESTPYDGTSKTSSPRTCSPPEGNSRAHSLHNPEYKHCESDCPILKGTEMVSCSTNACSALDYPKVDESDKSNCQTPVCTSKQQLAPSPADSNVIIHVKDIYNRCCLKSCDVAEKVKDFISDAVMSKKNITKPEADCYCDCNCSFKFPKTTTYCPICSGYECLGDDAMIQSDYARPHPCPVYHKLYDRTLIKTPNIWPEDPSKKPLPVDSTTVKGAKLTRSSSKTMQVEGKKSPTAVRSPKGKGKKKEKKQAKKVKEKKAKPVQKVGKLTVKVKKQKGGKKPEAQLEKKTDKQYIYPSVPKTMGWNWAAEDVPGMEPRPEWKPGAALKALVRKYRALREGLDILAKKKRAIFQKKKKIEFKPTLTISKEHGEYTVKMEVFKKYSKERLLYQNPYDDKPPLVYTVGKTPEENIKIQKQRDRRERRETRKKSRMLQSSFRDKCQEICLKAFNQSIGILPMPNPNIPDCPCSTTTEQELPPVVDSCSCSEEGTIASSDTDDDEWIIEFSPPAARYNPKAKHPPALADKESQYTYLDYKVKLLDKSGNQVARYFKGPDGNQECSDLGGFWSPDHVWLVINKDGFIAPDNKWAPMNFTGPDGMTYTAQDGGFTDSTGQVLKIGIDGYISKEGKWVWYGRRKPARNLKSSNVSSDSRIFKGGKTDTAVKDKTIAKGTTMGKVDKKAVTRPTEAKSDKVDKKAVTAALDAKNQKAKKPLSYATPGKTKNTVVMSVNTSVNYDRSRMSRIPYDDRLKNDTQKMAKYKEIMHGLQMYEDFCDLKPLIKTNRATQNTLRKKPSALVIRKNMASIRSTDSYGTSANYCSSSERRTLCYTN